LFPLDVAVALRLAQVPGAGYARLSHDLGIALSQAHASVRRLSKARLVSPKKREVNRRGLVEFLQHGVKYAFPAELGRVAIGVPTAYAGPPLANKLVFDEPIVWPSLDGESEGPAIDPLYQQAVSLPRRCPELYEALTVVDALRIGRAREQELAVQELERITRPSALQSESSNGRPHD
jgi:hypothetical protein